MGRDVAVLGLGNLGGAVAKRLSGTGWEVVGWTRSGAGVDGVSSVGSAREAASAAETVVLVLYDGAACRAVLDQVDVSGRTVVNLSTIGAAEAEDLAASVGAAGGNYVHAPVVGTVAPALAGKLVVLAGTGDETPVDELLGTLGTVVRVGTPGNAARAKLLANGALTNALLSIRDGLQQAAGLGLSEEVALDVLQHTALGGLVAGKRSRITSGNQDPADFTIDALHKDIELLAAETPAADGLLQRLRDATASGTAREGTLGDNDIAGVTRPGRDYSPTPTSGTLLWADGLDAAVAAPLRAYVRGHATGDPAHFREAFLPSAHIEGLRDGEFVSWTVDEYVGLFDGTPASDEDTRRRELRSLSVRGSIAIAEMELFHGEATFTDQFLLVRSADGWRIANKVYHRY